MKKNNNLVKNSLYLITLALLFTTPALHSAGKFNTFIIKLTNQLQLDRTGETVFISVPSIKKYYKNFDENNFIIKSNGKVIPFDVVNDSDENLRIVFQINFKQNEHKQVTISYSEEKPAFHNTKTNAYLGIKRNYILRDSIYTGGKFESTGYVSVPKSHFPHDALFQMEGPAWESDKIAYRFYLDERNRVDIFGKSTPKMVLNIIGKDDLLSGNESYQNMQWWGQDIFKVGNSLGIGSVAAYLDNKVITLSEFDSLNCSIFNHNLFSSVVSNHYGWKSGNNKYNANISYSIFPGSRLTEVKVRTNKPIANFCTGLAKHDSTKILSSNSKTGWGYVAVWGKQTICNDHLGIALFYNNNELINLTEDQVSHIVVLQPRDNRAHYYFAAAWEKEKKGIKSQRDFQIYLNQTIEILNNPIIVEIQ
jgi:hypothetical protein